MRAFHLLEQLLIVWPIIWPGEASGILLKSPRNHTPTLGARRGGYGLASKFTLRDEFSSNIFKQQVLNELKSSEDALKGVLFRIFTHVYEYVRYRLLNSFFNLYLINPFNIQLGNLLNTEINNHYLTSKLKIPNYSTPSSFGIPYRQVDVGKNFGYKLSSKCWFVEARDKDAKSAFILMHGWFGNMQSTLPFLNQLKMLGLLEKNHVLILNLYDDLTNSFESNVGLKGVLDLYDGVKFLHDALGVTHFHLYTQSVSSISALLLYDYILSIKGDNTTTATADSTTLTADSTAATTSSSRGGDGCYFKNVCDKELLRKVEFDTLILESPVVDVTGYSREYKYYNQLLSLTNSQFDCHLSRLNLSRYLSNPQIRRRCFILQGSRDRVASLEMLRGELSKVETLPHLFLFRRSGHADLCVHDPHEYKRALHYILRGNFLTRLVSFNKSRVKSLRNLH